MGKLLNKLIFFKSIAHPKICLLDTKCFYILPNGIDYKYSSTRKQTLHTKSEIEEKHAENINSTKCDLTNNLTKLRTNEGRINRVVSELAGANENSESYGHTSNPLAINKRRQRSNKCYSGKKRFNQLNSVHKQSLVLDEVLIDSVVVETVCECKFGFKIVLKMVGISSFTDEMPNRLVILTKRVFTVAAATKVTVYGDSSSLVKNKPAHETDNNWAYLNKIKPGLVANFDDAFEVRKRNSIRKSKIRSSEIIDKYKLHHE